MSGEILKIEFVTYSNGAKLIGHSHKGAVMSFQLSFEKIITSESNKNRHRLLRGGNPTK